MSTFQTEKYIEDGKRHFGDVYIGSDLVYGIKWLDWLTEEGDTFVAMVWDALPTGLTGSNESDSEGISYIQISADSAGCYRISGTIESVESGLTQFKAVEVYLTVFALGSC